MKLLPLLAIAISSPASADGNISFGSSTMATPSR